MKKLLLSLLFTLPLSTYGMHTSTKAEQQVALMTNIIEGNFEAAQQSIEQNNLNINDYYFGRSLISYTILPSSEPITDEAPRCEFLKYLINKDANVNLVDRFNSFCTKGSSPLDLCTIDTVPNCLLETLLEYGKMTLDKSITNAKNQTAQELLIESISYQQGILGNLYRGCRLKEDLYKKKLNILQTNLTFKEIQAKQLAYLHNNLTSCCQKLHNIHFHAE